MSEKIKVDREKCVHCGRCGFVCPMRIFAPSSDAPPEIAPYADEGCIDCGHCAAICPGGAIAVGEMTPETMPRCDSARLPSFETFVELAKYRRSIRHYKPEKVRKADLDRLFELLRYAPTAKNLLPLKWVVVNSPEKVRRLAEIAIDEFRDDANMALILDAWDRDGYDWIFRGAPCLVFALTETKNDWTPFDSTIAAEILDLAAPTLGLGACWAGFFIRAVGKFESLRRELGLTPENEVGGALMLGYPDDEVYRRTPPRPECSVRYVE